MLDGEAAPGPTSSAVQPGHGTHAATEVSTRSRKTTKRPSRVKAEDMAASSAP